MRIKVRYFGQFRDITGLVEELLETGDDVTVKELREQVRARYPRIRDKREVLVAVNNSFVSLDTVITPCDDVAFFPPVSGG